MRIAYLSGAYIPSQGANTMHVMGMCQAMAQLGHDVTLYARPGDLDVASDFKFYDVEPIFNISKQERPQIRAWGAFVNALRTRRALVEGEKPDLIYARETWALSIVVDLGIPFVFESHWLPTSVVRRTAEARLLRHPLLRRIIFISEALRQLYLDIFPWLDSDMTLVAHDAANNLDPTKEPNSICSGKRTTLQVGYVGSFQVGCGVGLISEVATLLPNVDFHIFGGSITEVDSWTENTSDIENLHFHGFIAPNRIRSIFGTLDVAIAPYQADTRSIQWASPMKLFEYMSHGKAIICSDFPVFREVLEQGVTGILVNADRPEDWARAIGELRDNDGLRRRLGSAGRESLEHNFTWRGRAERILSGSVLGSIK